MLTWRSCPFRIGEKLLAYPLGRKCHPAKIDLPKSPGNRYPALFCKTPLLIVWGNRNVRCKRCFSHVGIIFLFGVSFSGKPRLFPFFLSNLQPVFPQAANWGVECWPCKACVFLQRVFSVNPKTKILLPHQKRVHLIYRSKCKDPPPGFRGIKLGSMPIRIKG